MSRIVWVYSKDELDRIRRWAEQREHWLDPDDCHPPAGARPEHRCLVADVCTVFSISVIEGIPCRIVTFVTRDKSEPPFILCQCIAWDLGFTGNADEWGRTEEDSCPEARGFVQPLEKGS